jgi:ribosomal protein S27AE
MLIFTLAITGLGSYWLGQSAFDVVGGYGFLALGLIFYAGLVLVLFRRLAEIHRGRNRLCPNCGYDRKGDLYRTACPECGYTDPSFNNADASVL